MLEIRRLSKTYSKGKKAVEDLSLDILAGDIYGFIGPNGAGKTTTIRAIVGVMDFDEGEIYIEGHCVRAAPIACKSVTGYIPDNPDIYAFLTGVQYLSYIADIFSISRNRREAGIAKYSGIFGMSSALGDPISSYSHGMRQKLVLIGALIHEPKFLVLDEPFVGLDPEASFHLKKIMRELCESGRAIFFSTHILEVAEKLCSKIAIIREGKLIVSGPIDQVRGQKSLEKIFLEVVGHE
ncbi:MAG: ABC transporter ATP-binding protein [Spirochaetota bacterium]|nr:ABC transporter ATP-binding protein [Spirochaetota bacterium]